VGISQCYHPPEPPRPLTAPYPRPMPLVVRRDPVAAPRTLPLVTCPPTATYPLVAVVVVLVPRLVGRPLPLGGAFEGFAAASARRFSSSSAVLAAAIRRSFSSCSLLSAACCFAYASRSASARSLLAPCQEGLRISLWLCSVCDNMRVQVLRSAEAESTV